MIDFLLANLGHVIRVQTKRGKTIKGRLWRVGCVSGIWSVDLLTKSGVRSFRVR